MFSAGTILFDTLCISDCKENAASCKILLKQDIFVSLKFTQKQMLMSQYNHNYTNYE